MSYVVGCDFSTHAIDFVYVDENDVEAPSWYRCPLEGPDSFERTRVFARSTIPSLPWDDVLAVGIEDPAGHHGTNYLYRMQGAILAHIPLPILVQPWRPSQWRKAVGLPGNASKQQVKAFADAMLPRPHIDDRPSWATQDAADAWCIALATRLAITREKAA